jgi:large conductance mechanosensitive channel
MGILKEFREFAVKGNAVEMAVGIVIGAAFSGIVSSLVKDIIMPPLGMLAGSVDFTNRFITLAGDETFKSLKLAQDAGVPTINYGIFLNNLLNFVIIAFCIFVVVKQMNRLNSLLPKPSVEPTTKTCPQCLSTIPIKAVRCAHCTSPLEN